MSGHGELFTDEQRELAGAVREMLDKECSPPRLRDAWESLDAAGTSRWEALAAMGVLGLLVPEADGGLGMDEVDAALVWQELGRAAVPEPVLDTMCAAPAVDAWSDQPDQMISVVHPQLHPNAVWGAHAHLILDATTGTPLHPGAPTPSVDPTRHLTKARSGGVNERMGTHARPQNRVVVAHAAALCGVSERMLEMTVGYVKERRQFGRPIGSFQAVKHHLADALLALEMARPLVWQACRSLAAGAPDASVHVSMAKARASEAAELVAGRALQCHAAMGYTTEYDLHLYMKRAWAWSRAWGDAGHHLDVVAAAVVDEQAEQGADHG